MYPQGAELGIPWSDNFGSSVDMKCRQVELVDNSPGGNWYIPLVQPRRKLEAWNIYLHE